jgi:hypothetical protein
MPDEKIGNGTGRRLMHTRSVECNGYIRDDGLWEVEARLVDVKPFTQAPDRYREELKPGDPVHDIRLRLAIDDTMKIHEAEATMAATPYPTCIEVEPVLQRLVGESIGKGWREVVRRKIGRLEGCTHLSELGQAAVLHRRLPFLAHRRTDRRRQVSAICDQIRHAGLGPFDQNPILITKLQPAAAVRL